MGWVHLPAQHSTLQAPLMPSRLQEPVLWTSTRARPSRFKSRIEEEAEEMEKAEPFHARPVK